MKYDHVVFDLDGTLLDTESAVLCSLQDTVFHFTQKWPDRSSLYFALGITSEDALEKLSIPDISAAAVYWNEAMRRYTDSITIFAGIPEILETLRNAGCKVGIVTSKTIAEFEADFVPFGIASCFDAIVCADDTTLHKPHAEPLLKYLELAHADRQKTLYIGDSPFDQRCAKNAGVDFALAGWGAHDPSIPARYFLTEPCDLLKLI